jgi:AcrR family transcriptional regulator
MARGVDSLRAGMPAKPASSSVEQPAARGNGERPPGTRRRYAPRMAPAERREQLIDAALEVILEQGYERVSIEAIARKAGVTRPVIYDHFPNLGRLLSALIDREERISVGQLEEVVPDELRGRNPVELLAGSVRRFLEAVASRPATWRIILLPLEGTPQVVRDHVETNRARTLERIERLVRWALERSELADDLDVELTARALLIVCEDAGRTLLTDPEAYPPERYERFVRRALDLVLPKGN